MRNKPSNSLVPAVGFLMLSACQHSQQVPPVSADKHYHVVPEEPNQTDNQVSLPNPPTKVSPPPTKFDQLTEPEKREVIRRIYSLRAMLLQAIENLNLEQHEADLVLVECEPSIISQIDTAITLVRLRLYKRFLDLAPDMPFNIYIVPVQNQSDGLAIVCGKAFPHKSKTPPPAEGQSVAVLID